MKKRIKHAFVLLTIFVFAGWYSAINSNNICVSHPSVTQKDTNTVLGFGFLKRIVGQWNGPVISSTPAGNFDSWYVDFRPISAGQVSQFTSFDSSSTNYTSFFIVKHNNQLKVAMRTEGVFKNKGCVTYEVMDSVNESKGYYLFSDFQSGRKRAYTVFTFNDDAFQMEVYTNKFNKVNPLQLHSRYEAKQGSREAANDAVSFFSFPQPKMIKDFSDAFKNMTESIFYTFENDPYPSSQQPYVGSVTVNISVDNELKYKNTDEIFLLLTTESLFKGIKYKPENLKYKSKYVLLPAYKKTYTIKDVHPGKYYLYSFIDINGDKKHLSGDYMCSDANNVLTLKPDGKVIVETKIDMVIP
ncbi:MAG: hypothetical protein V2A54_02830 [Bacteroidota bacterium]